MAAVTLAEYVRAIRAQVETEKRSVRAILADLEHDLGIVDEHLPGECRICDWRRRIAEGRCHRVLHGEVIRTVACPHGEP